MDIVGFALAVLLIELTPGPNRAWLAGLAATEGRRSGLAAVAIGLLANGILAALGLTALLEVAPGLWHGLRLAGAAMMTWLAVEIWRGTEPGISRRPPEATARRAFLTGAFINLLDPRAYIFFLVVAPQFLGGGTLDLAAAPILLGVSAAIATVIHLAVVLAGSRAHVFLSDPARTPMVRRLFAIVMLAVGLSFLVSDLG